VSQSGLPAHRGIGRHWIVDVTVSAGGETDLISFGLELDE
jgi:hypothetical protein